MIGFEQSELRSFYDQLMDLIARKSPTLAPNVMEVAVSDYTDRERWEREVEFFRTTPMFLALSDEVREPGSYWAMTRVGVPLLLTRTKSGEVKLFINACRHRGVKVVEDGKGKQPRFTCIYHAWTYGLDGRLIGLPENRIFGDVDKGKFGLTQLAVEERDGLIWGMLTPGRPLALDDYLNPEMADILTKCGFDRFKVVNQIDLPAVNWKLTLEGYLETYHFNTVHAKSFVSFIIPNVLGWRKVGRHTLVLTPVLGIDKCDPESEEDLRRFVQVAFVLHPSTFFAFASSAAFASGDEAATTPVERIFINQVLPGDTPETSITISRTVVSADFMGTPIEAETLKWSHMTHEVVRTEDYPVVQLSQATLHSGAQETFIIGRNEIGIQHLHTTMHEALGDKPMEVAERPHEIA